MRWSFSVHLLRRRKRRTECRTRSGLRRLGLGPSRLRFLGRICVRELRAADGHYNDLLHQGVPGRATTGKIHSHLGARTFRLPDHLRLQRAVGQEFVRDFSPGVLTCHWWPHKLSNTFMRETKRTYSWASKHTFQFRFFNSVEWW